MDAHRLTQVSLKNMLNLDTENILTILYNTQTTKSSDPRDRLYATLRIISDAVEVGIGYSISVQEAYRSWAEKRIRRTNALDILSVVQTLVDLATCLHGFLTSGVHLVKINTSGCGHIL